MDLNALPQLGAAHQSIPGTSFDMSPQMFAESMRNGHAPSMIRRRRFSAKIQPTRIKKVMQADDDIGRMVASVPVAIGRAMEHFAEELLQTSSQIAQASSSRTLSAAHMKRAIMNKPYFHFLMPMFEHVRLNSGNGMDFESAFSGDELVLPLLPPIEGTDMKLESIKEEEEVGLPLAAVSQALSASALNLQQQLTLPPMQSPVLVPAVNIPPALPSPMETPPVSLKRKSVDSVEPAEPRKRGRPRKIKKDDKVLDQELCEEVDKTIKQEDHDRELMPPPALPLSASRANEKPQILHP